MRHSWVGHVVSHLFTIISLCLAVDAVSQEQALPSARASSLTLVSVGSDESLSWHSGENPAAREDTLWGRLGDHLVPGPWQSADVVALGVVRLEGGNVRWHVRGDDGSSSMISLGTAESVILAAADYDGNGVSDASVVDVIGGRLVWTIKPNPFGVAPGEIVSVSFGRAGDTPLFFSPDGKDDRLAILRTTPRGTREILYRGLTSRNLHRISLGPYAVAESSPFPLKNSEGADLLAFPKSTSEGVNFVLVRLGRRARITASLFLPPGISVVGDFVPEAPGEEIAVQSGDSTGFHVAGRGVPTPLFVLTRTGIPVDLVNVNTFTQAPKTPPVDLPPPGPCLVSDASDGHEGFLWKPKSDTQRFAVTLLPAKYTGYVDKVETLKTDGTPIKRLSFKGVGNGNRTHWQDQSSTGLDYARSYGTIRVKATLSNGGCLTYNISTPAFRVD